MKFLAGLQISPCCGAKMLSLHLRLYIPACLSSLMASSCNEGSTWKLSIYSMMLECSLLQYCINFASTYSCFSFSFLHSIFHALRLISLSLPVHQFYASWSGPGSWQFVQTKLSLLSIPLLKSKISPIFPTFSSATSWASQWSQNIFQFQLSIAVNLIDVSQSQ